MSFKWKVFLLSAMLNTSANFHRGEKAVVSLRWLSSCLLSDRSGNDKISLGQEEYTLFRTKTQTGLFPSLTQLSQTKTYNWWGLRLKTNDLDLLLNFSPVAQKLVCYRWHRAPGRWVRSPRCEVVCPQCTPWRASPACAARPHNPTRESVWQLLSFEGLHQYDLIDHRK